MKINNKNLEDSWGFKEFISKKTYESYAGKVLKYLKHGDDSYALVFNAGDRKKLWRFRSIDYVPMEEPAHKFSNIEAFIKYTYQHRVREHY